MALFEALLVYLIPYYKYSDRYARANSLNPDKTAPEVAVLPGFILLPGLQEVLFHLTVLPLPSVFLLFI